MKKLKNNKGITLITLAIVIVVLTIIAVSVTASLKTTVELSKYYEIKEDIITLTEECQDYYKKNGELPIKGTSISTFTPNNEQKNENDNGEYYQIDETKLTDLILNKQSDDYIINEQSLTVYYPQGFKLNDKIQYTIIDVFESGDNAENYYENTNLSTTSLLSSQSNGRNKTQASYGDTVTLRIYETVKDKEHIISSLKINNEFINTDKITWSGNIGTVTYVIPNTMEDEKSGKKIAVEVIANGETFNEDNIIFESAMFYKKLKIGDYISYDLPYKDVYTGYDFITTEENKNGGWRILDPGILSVDGTYSEVKLISTGIPVAINYNPEKLTQNFWYVEDVQIDNYTNKFYKSSSKTNKNMWAATGLYYNFGKIMINQGTSASENVGYFTKVNNKTSGTLDENEFINKCAKEVHNLTLYELNKARNTRVGEDRKFGLNQTELNSINGGITAADDGANGLFILKQLNDFGYTLSSNYDFILASPSVENDISLAVVESTGVINNTVGARTSIGLRLVVTLKPSIEISLSEGENSNNNPHKIIY